MANFFVSKLLVRYVVGRKEGAVDSFAALAVYRDSRKRRTGTN